jgi:hypothetical protein
VTEKYATARQLAQRLGIGDGESDEALDAVLEAVSRQIDDHCHRRFWSTSETRYFTALAADRLYVGDLLSVAASGLKTDEDRDGTHEVTWGTGDFTLWPPNNALEALPYWELRTTPLGVYGFPTGPRGVSVTGVFGYAATTPPVVAEACLHQSELAYRSKDAPLGIAGGGEFQSQVQAIGLHPFTRRLLDPYRLRGAA